MFPPVGVFVSAAGSTTSTALWKCPLQLCLKVGQAHQAVLDVWLELHKEIDVAISAKVIPNCAAERRQPIESPFLCEGGECARRSPKLLLHWHQQCALAHRTLKGPIVGSCVGPLSGSGGPVVQAQLLLDACLHETDLCLRLPANA